MYRRIRRVLKILVLKSLFYDECELVMQKSGRCFLTHAFAGVSPVKKNMAPIFVDSDLNRSG